MVFTPEDLLKMLLALVAGGLIGAEREYREKTAGFRTIIFITLGGTIFTLLSIKIGGSGNPDRIASNIVTGIGFLGAGAILKDQFGVTGLTTAATVWFSAALGMGIGGGYYEIAILGTVFAMIVLWIFPRLQAWIDRRRMVRLYEVIVARDFEKLAEIDKIFSQSGLRVLHHSTTKTKKTLTCTWHLVGKPEKQEALVDKLLQNPDIREFKY
jgi:putative Mg2+ transporter-C (MgtC) family protein